MKNKKAGRRSAPHVGENGGLFRYIGAYVAFASFVYHSLVVLVIAFTESFGYPCKCHRCTQGAKSSCPLFPL